MNSFLEPARAERKALSPGHHAGCLPKLPQTCTHRAFSGWMTGSKMVAQWHIFFLQREAIFEMEPNKI